MESPSGSGGLSKSARMELRATAASPASVKRSEQASRSDVRRRRNEVGLVAEPGVFTDAAIVGLTDELLVPLIVDHILKDVLKIERSESC